MMMYGLLFVGCYGGPTANADHRSLGRRDSYGIFVIQKMRTVTLCDVKQSFRPGERQISRIPNRVVCLE